MEKDAIPEALSEATSSDPDIKEEKEHEQYEMIFTETLSVNSVTTDGWVYFAIIIIVKVRGSQFLFTVWIGWCHN